MRTVSAVCCAGGLLVLCLASSLGARAEEPAREEMVNNPIYKHWSAFKVGTTVTRREKVKFPSKSEEGQRYHDGTLVKDVTHKLVEVTPEKVVVEVVEAEHGRGSLTESAPFRITYFSHIKKGLGTPKENFAHHKQQDVEVEAHGKKYQGTLVETSYTRGPVAYSQNIWLSDDMPGGIIKEVKTQKQGDEVLSESTLEVLKFTKAP
jgi:hypothetical protein